MKLSNNVIEATKLSLFFMVVSPIIESDEQTAWTAPWAGLQRYRPLTTSSNVIVPSEYTERLDWSNNTAFITIDLVYI